MNSKIMLSQNVQKLLVCPICHASLKLENGGRELKCIDSKCSISFPIINGVPVLINEQSSIFSIDDFVSCRKTYFGNMREGRLKRIIRSLLMPSIGEGINLKAIFNRLNQELTKQSGSPLVLVIGGSVLGQGMEYLVNNTTIDFVDSDVSSSSRTMLICDAHDIPFADGSFDGVIVQAVLEHVADPFRCCEELHRVLKNGGVVYSETPFMQQVHGGCYDFTRFTHLGHRRLFRRFKEIDSGALGGPGMALAWSYQYFLLSFTTSKTLRKLLRIFTSLTSFYLKYFDYYLFNKPGALDAASCCYFMGRKEEDIIVSDKDLIKLYKGAV